MAPLFVTPRLPLAAHVLGVVFLTLAPGMSAHAAPVRPRFVVLFDTSGSMSENAGRVETHGDGSKRDPGCDLDNNGAFDDSKLFAAKAALSDTITAFGAAEFSLARYHQNELGGQCNVQADCKGTNSTSNACSSGLCSYDVPLNNPDYDECRGGNVNNGCIRCADPDNDPTTVFYNGNLCCVGTDPKANGFGMAGDVLVGFPNGNTPNQRELLSWIDGEETFPLGADKELRAVGITPIGGSLNAVRDWLINDASPAGPAGGVLNRDSQVDCRSYNVILITDGIETASCTTNCGTNGAAAAENLYYACTNAGLWDPVDARCERAGVPTNTRRIKVRTYVVGFTVNDPSLNAIAASGGTGAALLANNRAELTARLGDIIAASIPNEKCDCKDNTCDGEIDETFSLKGEVCSVGVGRCKREGVYACKADGSAVTCSATPAGMCPASDLSMGAAIAEGCGAAAGCLAPTPQDCADDDCDGLVDENLSCTCAVKPEVCNGLDDDCNGTIDDIPNTSCGLSIGECRPGQLQCASDGAGGKKAVCVGGSFASPELCDRKDNDCDGITDGFGLSCFPDNAAGCLRNVTPVACQAAPADAWTCKGICATGVLACEGGECGACLGAITPQPEFACDGLDNDCDGETDEGFGLGLPCGQGQSGKGLCLPGVLKCVQNSLSCEGGRGPSEEICNGQDDDCDDVVDNIAGTCRPAQGECSAGVWRCEGTTPECEQARGPKPEFCDGKDNDCDGNTDEDPMDADLVVPTDCGVAEGICRKGMLKCLGGGKYCDQSVDPSFERCNALDDDCDGNTDEGINAPGMCPPPGLAAGSGAKGECRPGANMCVADGQGGAAWGCVGGVGPAIELCDGKDQDCDGVVDNQAVCPPGFGCAFGECAPRCAQGEFQCGSERVCVDGLCVQTECVRSPCAQGFRCDFKRGCVDRCEGVSCPEGFRCDNGSCVSCQVDGCPSGQLCRGDKCEPDPCLSISCNSGTYCSEGACAASCTGVKCKSGQSCRLGQCVVDKCLGVACAPTAFCQPSTGSCEPNPCLLIRCLRGQRCVPSKAVCAPDPCLATACKGKDVCFVFDDGVAECLAPESLPGISPFARVAAGGSGCNCGVGGAGSNGASGWLLTLVAAVFVRTRKQKRKKRRHPLRAASNGGVR